VVAVSVDPVAKNREVVEKLGLEFPILSDADRRVIAAYGVVHRHGGMGGTDIARPAVFVIGPDGVVRWRGLTENWRVRERPQHLLDVLRSLR